MTGVGMRPAVAEDGQFLFSVYCVTIRDVVEQTWASGRLPLAETLLRSADVPFVATGEHLQQLTGLDVFGPAERRVAGPARIGA